MLKGVIPITQIKKWTQAELKEFCEHIVSHSERYMSERVFEAKSILSTIGGADDDKNRMG